MAGDAQTAALEALRVPFAPEHVGKLPRVTCQDCSNRDKNCTKHQKAKCNVCAAYVSTAHIHLDYVGHAGITDRLLSVDLTWDWEPLAWTPEGLPLVTYTGNRDSTANLWIKLTVAGVTRKGVGTADAGKPELMKELIGDALRNAAMRFGVALSLWNRAELESADTPTEAAPAPAKKAKAKPASVPDGEPFDEAPRFASAEAVDALLAEIRNSSEGVRDGLKAFMAEKQLPALSAHREEYPAPFFDLIDSKLAELQDKADGK